MSKVSRKGRGVRGRMLPANAPLPKSSAQLDADPQALHRDALATCPRPPPSFVRRSCSSS
jgi:hypothetical protein